MNIHRKPAPTKCSINGCEEKVHAKEMCKKHYKRELYQKQREQYRLKYQLKKAPTRQKQRLANRAELVALHRANPITQALNW